MPDVVPLHIIRGVGVRVIDQTRLPGELAELLLADLEAVCEAIEHLRVRGAPLLGIVAACGMAIASQRLGADEATLAFAAERLRSTRPTAVDLHRAIGQALEVARRAGTDPEARRTALWEFAERLLLRQRSRDLAMARHGASLLPAGATVLTHCNTGALATGGVGTALGVVREAWRQGKLARCFATETRPLLQGGRLTVWELREEGIPVTLLVDGAAPSLLATGRIDAVLVGADRIARNGDTANKVGTYALAIAAAHHGVPFYVVAPSSSFDLACPTGSAIPIEQRAEQEVTVVAGRAVAPAGTEVYNPAFDVTPAELVTAWVTEVGAVRPPFSAIAEALDDAGSPLGIH